MYGKSSDAGKRPPAHRPTETAGLKWAPEIGPSAYAPVSTVRPKASATPANPIPSSGKAAASTALPQPPRTSQNVPRNSAAIFGSMIHSSCIFGGRDPTPGTRDVSEGIHRGAALHNQRETGLLRRSQGPGTIRTIVPTCVIVHEARDSSAHAGSLAGIRGPVRPDRRLQWLLVP